MSHRTNLRALCCVSLIASLMLSSAIAEQRNATDFAQAMPAETLAYLEIRDPAGHVERLAEAMGLMGDRDSRHDPVTIELDDGFVLSSDFRISPALLAELKRVRGAAAAITGPLQDNEPQPLIVIDPGESSLLRGLMETGIQVVPRAERIGGYPTYHHADADLWIVQTASLFMASNQQEHLKAAVKRLSGKGKSLAENETFAACRRENDDALLFAYADGANFVKHMGPMMQDEAAIARAVMDLDHVRCATAMITATDSGAKAEFRIDLDEDHHSLAYGMIRTVPFRKSVFARIPDSAALVAAVGVNPSLRFEGETSRNLTALDIGREFFANLADVAMFVLPSVDAGGDEVPNFGLVVRANDAEKSEALWSQLLALPTMLGSDEGPNVEEITVAGHTGRRYTFSDDDAPTLDMVRIDDATIVVGTRTAVRDALSISGKRESILGDDDLASAIEGAPQHASKAIFAHVGRLAQLAAQLEGGNDAKQLAVVSQVLKHMKVSMVSDEAPDELTVRFEASELPVFEEVIRMVAKMQKRHAQSAAVVHRD